MAGPALPTSITVRAGAGGDVRHVVAVAHMEPAERGEAVVGNGLLDTRGAIVFGNLHWVCRRDQVNASGMESFFAAMNALSASSTAGSISGA